MNLFWQVAYCSRYFKFKTQYRTFGCKVYLSIATGAGFNLKADINLNFVMLVLILHLFSYLFILSTSFTVPSASFALSLLKFSITWVMSSAKIMSVQFGPNLGMSLV